MLRFIKPLLLQVIRKALEPLLLNKGTLTTLCHCPAPFKSYKRSTHLNNVRNQAGPLHQHFFFPFCPAFWHTDYKSHNMKYTLFCLVDCFDFSYPAYSSRVRLLFLLFYIHFGSEEHKETLCLSIWWYFIEHTCSPLSESFLKSQTVNQRHTRNHRAISKQYPALPTLPP